MTENTKQYSRAKFAFDAAKMLSEKIGKPYNGGGGGIGKVHSMSLNLTVYYQATDGATNYHKSEQDFDIALSRAAKIHADILIKEALQILEDEKISAAKALISAMDCLKDEIEEYRNRKTKQVQG